MWLVLRKLRGLLRPPDQGSRPRWKVDRADQSSGKLGRFTAEFLVLLVFFTQCLLIDGTTWTFFIALIYDILRQNHVIDEKTKNQHGWGSNTTCFRASSLSDLENKVSQYFGLSSLETSFSFYKIITFILFGRTFRWIQCYSYCCSQKRWDVFLDAFSYLFGGEI